jgi:holo-[acyl-carrier protein] synthase
VPEQGAPEPPARDAEGVVASAVEIVEIEEAARLLADGSARAVFTDAELAYARARSDPARRLAARLAAKRAAARLLGDGLEEAEVEVVRGEYGPPALRLSPRALSRLHALGAVRALVSLTHERSQAAALVVLVGGA